MTQDAWTRLSSYYDRTAGTYDNEHVAPGDEHSIALEYIAGIARTFDVSSILDVGAGTGRALRILDQRLRDVKLVGVEPSAALRAEALDSLHLLPGLGEQLPFGDETFDFVLATGVMHHLRNPERVIHEMLRVARVGVAISDSNRYGQGSLAARLFKSLLAATHSWKAFNWARTRGKYYMESEGDGLFYSYSIYDNLRVLQSWADRVIVIPTRGSARGVTGPLLGASHGLILAVREPSTDWAGKVSKVSGSNG